MAGRSSQWPKVRKRAFNRDRKANAPCAICHRPIDYSLGMSSNKNYDPMKYEPDHILNVAKHPELELDLANIQPAHAGCNRRKNDRAGLNLLGIPSEEW